MPSKTSSRKPPTVTVALERVGEVTVAFQMDVIADIEDAVNAGAYAFFDTVRAMIPIARELDGRQLTDDEIRDLPEADRERLLVADAERERAVREIRLSTVHRFLSGCLGIPLNEVSAAVGPGKVFEVFFLLISAFAEALAQLSGQDSPGKPTPVASIPAATGGTPSGEASAF